MCSVGVAGVRTTKPSVCERAETVPVVVKVDSLEASSGNVDTRVDVSPVLYAGAGSALSATPSLPCIDRKTELEAEHEFFCSNPMSGEDWDLHFEGCDLARAKERAKPSQSPYAYESWVTDAINRMGCLGECRFRNTCDEDIVLKIGFFFKSTKTKEILECRIEPGRHLSIGDGKRGASLLFCEAYVDTLMGQRQVPLDLKEKASGGCELTPTPEGTLSSCIALSHKKSLPSFVLCHPELTGGTRLLKDKHALEIPPVWHFVWLGTTLSVEERNTLATFRALHPDYAMVLWTDIKKEYLDSAAGDIHEQIRFCRAYGIRLVNFEEYFGPYLGVGPFNTPNIAMAFRHYVDVNQFGGASDIMRLVVLSHMGGGYADTDRRMFQNIDHLRKSHDFLGLGKLSEGREAFEGNDFMMSVPGHPAFYTTIAPTLERRVSERFRERLFGGRSKTFSYDNRDNQYDPSFGGVIWTTGPSMLSCAYAGSVPPPFDVLPENLFEKPKDPKNIGSLGDRQFKNRFVLRFEEEAEKELLVHVRQRYETPEQFWRRCVHSFVGEINIYGLNGISLLRMVRQLSKSQTGLLSYTANIAKTIEEYDVSSSFVHPGAKQVALALASVLECPRTAALLSDKNLHFEHVFPYRWHWGYKVPFQLDIPQRTLTKLVKICAESEEKRKDLYEFLDVETLAMLMQSADPSNPAASCVLLMDSERKKELAVVFKRHRLDNNDCRMLGMKLCRTLAMILEQTAASKNVDILHFLASSGPPDDEDFESYCNILQRRGWWNDWMKNIFFDGRLSYWTNVSVLQDMNVALFLTKALKDPRYAETVKKAVEELAMHASEIRGINSYSFFPCVAFMKSVATYSIEFGEILETTHIKMGYRGLKKAMEAPEQKKIWDVSSYISFCHTAPPSSDSDSEDC